MNLSEIANFRLVSQQVAATNFRTPKALAGWMGALQAQDYAMAKWALGVRLPDSTDQSIQDAIDTGEIIRTHLLRPTWHIVSSDDIYWLLELTAPYIKASSRSRNAELDLTGATFAKSNAVIEKALQGGKSLTRAELVTELQNAQIATGDNRSSHLLMQAELDRLVCSGVSRGGKQTYALLEERVPKPKSVPREEALAMLAKRYFTSHGPADFRDFVWWSGLSVGDARTALELVKSDLISETIDSQTLWFGNDFPLAAARNETAYLLPAYDEFIISYADRRAALPSENHNLMISNNGIFKPVIIVGGQVSGLWRRTIKNDRLIVETDFFRPPEQAVMGLIEAAASQFGRFLGKKTELSHPD